MCHICKHFNPNYLSVVTTFHDGGIMNPEPLNEKPAAKPEIRGGDKFADYVPNLDEEGTYPYLDDYYGFLDDAWDDDL
jgi:hypothetical protein